MDTKSDVYARIQETEKLLADMSDNAESVFNDSIDEEDKNQIKEAIEISNKIMKQVKTMLNRSGYSNSALREIDRNLKELRNFIKSVNQAINNKR